jgi:two-component system, OmpR family, alkaline phosphatase synthesis response regulator PhoP
MGTRVLLIEDEVGLVVALTDRLQSEGYQVETAVDGQTGLARAQGESFDLIILDVMLPEKSGFDICRDLRGQGIKTPILMLTARGQVVDRVLGLKLGADDYLVKPFEPIELLARMEALLRRIPPPSPMSALEIYKFGEMRVDVLRSEVTRNGAPVDIPPREYKLLCYLIRHRGLTISRHQLLDEVWGYDAMVTTRTVDVHVAGLRQKIETDPRHPQYLLTIHGLGYKFVG